MNVHPAFQSLEHYESRQSPCALIGIDTRYITPYVVAFGAGNLNFSEGGLQPAYS